MPKNKRSILARLFIVSVYAFAFSSFQMWETGAKGGDPLGYYSYLPATFLYQDFEDLILYDCGEWQPDSHQLALKERLYFNDFEKSDSLTIITPPVAYDGKAYKMGASKKIVLLKKSIQELGLKKGEYIKVTTNAMKATGGAKVYSSSILAIRFERSTGRGLKTRRIRMDNKIANPTHSFWGHYTGNVWSEIPFYSHVPNLPDNAVLEVYLQYGSPMAIYVDDLSIEIWKEK